MRDHVVEVRRQVRQHICELEVELFLFVVRALALLRLESLDHFCVLVIDLSVVRSQLMLNVSDVSGGCGFVISGGIAAVVHGHIAGFN